MLQQRQKRGIVVTGAGVGVRVASAETAGGRRASSKPSSRRIGDEKVCSTTAHGAGPAPGMTSSDRTTNWESPIWSSSRTSSVRDVTGSPLTKTVKSASTVSRTNDGGEERKRTEGPDAGEAERVSPSTRIKTSPNCGPLVARSFIVLPANSIAHGFARRFARAAARHRLRTIRSDSAVVDRIGVPVARSSAGPWLLHRVTPYLTLQQAVRACWRRSVVQCRQRGIAVAQVWTASEDEEQEEVRRSEQVVARRRAMRVRTRPGENTG